MPVAFVIQAWDRIGGEPPTRRESKGTYGCGVHRLHITERFQTTRQKQNLIQRRIMTCKKKKKMCDWMVNVKESVPFVAPGGDDDVPLRCISSVVSSVA